MEFLAVCVSFAALVLGLVLITMSIVGGDPGQPLSSRFFGIGSPVIDHGPERHRLRTFALGLLSLGVATVIAVLWVA